MNLQNVLQTSYDAFSKNDRKKFLRHFCEFKQYEKDNLKKLIYSAKALLVVNLEPTP